MGLQKNYFKYGQSAREKIFGIPRDIRTTRQTTSSAVGGGGLHTTPLSMLISQGTKFNSSKFDAKCKLSDLSRIATTTMTNGSLRIFSQLYKLRVIFLYKIVVCIDFDTIEAIETR